MSVMKDSGKDILFLKVINLIKDCIKYASFALERRRKLQGKHVYQSWSNIFIPNVLFEHTRTNLFATSILARALNQALALAIKEKKETFSRFGYSVHSIT